MALAALAGFSVLVLLAAYGWGIPIVRSHSAAAYFGPVFTTCVGFAAFIPVCALAMLTGAPGSTIIWWLLGAGWCITLVSVVRAVRARRAVSVRSHAPGAWRQAITSVETLPRALAIVLAAGTLVFLATSLVPSVGFNHGDDYRYYLLRPLRFLAEGQLFGDLYDPILMDSLGGQALYHAVFLSGLPLTYIKGFDGVLCVGLALALLIEYAWRTGASAWALTLALSLMIVIHPQAVNESALYSGVMLMVALFYLLQMVHCAPDHANDDTTNIGQPKGALAGATSSIWLMALLLVALLATKNTFIFFTAAFFVLYTLGTRLAVPGSRSVLAVWGRFGCAATVLGLPFVLLSFERIEAALTPSEYAVEALPLTAQASNFLSNMEGLLRYQPLLYGGTSHMYLALTLLSLAVGIVALAWLLRSRGTASAPALVVPCAALLALSVSYAVVGGIMGVEHGIRYAAPVFVAVVPFAYLSLSNNPALQAGPDGRHRLPGKIKKVALVLLFGFVPVMFVELMPPRIARASVYGTQVSYPYDAQLHAHGRMALGQHGQKQLRAMQEAAPQGARLLAFVPRPFQLDFARNPLQVVSEWGLVTPWNPLPFYASSAEVMQHLRASGVQYVLWHYRPESASADSIYRVHAQSERTLFRKFGLRNLYLVRVLGELSALGRVVKDDGRVRLIELRRGRQDPQ